MPRRKSNVDNHRKVKDVKQVVPRDRYAGDILRLYIEMDIPVPRGDSWSTFEWNNHYARPRKPKRNRGGGYRGR